MRLRVHIKCAAPVLLVAASALLFPSCRGYRRKPSDVTAQRVRDLSAGDPETRRTAAIMLRFNPVDKVWSVPGLIGALSDRDEEVKFHAYQSLQELTGNTTLPRDPKAWDRWWGPMAQSYKERHKPPEDILQAEKAKIYSEEAVLMMAQGSFLAAENKLVQAIHLDPENVHYHVNLAKCYNNMKRYEDALGKTLEAIRLDPDVKEAYVNQGEAYEGLDKPYEAITAYKEALKREAGNPDWFVRYRLGKVYLKRNMLGEARNSIDEAIKLNPRQPHLHVTSALVNYAFEEYYAAWQEVEKVRELGYDWENEDFVDKLKTELKRMGMEFPEDEGKGKLPPAFSGDDLEVLLSPDKEKPLRLPSPAGEDEGKEEGTEEDRR